MTEIILGGVILLQLIHSLARDRQFLSHLERLENKLAKIDNSKVESPNEIEENRYRDIADVTPAEVMKHDE